MQQFQLFIPVLVAALLGSVIGWQREWRGKQAGPRTYALVTAGSALFTVLSINGFGPAEGGRVAANIIVGIGFLGAGLILHHDNRVEGLTTAAGLWAAAAVGMAAGTSYYYLAVGATVLMLILLMIDDRRFKKIQNTPNASSKS